MYVSVGARAGSSGESEGWGADAVGSLSALVFERDLTSDVEGVGGGASPVAVGCGCAFESFDEELLGAARPGTRVARGSDGVEAVPGPFELGRVEGRGGAQDGLLAGVEVVECLVVEVAQAPGEVAVGCQPGVVPRGSGVGA